MMLQRRLQPTTRSMTPLTDDQMRRWAPSIFASEPWHTMSARYAFIPTIEVVNGMRNAGFQPVMATQARTRIPGKGDFTKHMIRFRDFRNGDVPAIRELGQIYTELILTNAHDGASAYKLDAGLFRLICMNGAVVSAGNLEHVNIRHTGDASDVVSITHEIVDEFPKVIDSVQAFSRLELTAPQQEAFGRAALTLKYDTPEAAPFPVKALLAPVRHEDAKPTLWNTFNVVQEKMVNGGMRGRNPETRRRTRTRPVTGISENLRLNKALWTLAEEMRKMLTS